MRQFLPGRKVIAEKALKTDVKKSGIELKTQLPLFFCTGFQDF